MVEHLTSPSNPTLKRLRALRDKKFRRAEGRFLAEGLRIVTEALEAGIVPEVLVFGAESARHPLVERLVAATEGGGGTAIETNADMLGKLTARTIRRRWSECFGRIRFRSIGSTGQRRRSGSSASR